MVTNLSTKMSHGIISIKNENDIYEQLRTDDVEAEGSEKGYHWEGVYPNSKTEGGKRNAGKFFLFALLTRSLF
jgi:hypothetical protein